MNAFLERLLGNEDPMVEVVRTELGYAKRVDSLCNESLTVEKNEAERLYLNDGLGRVASLRQQAKSIKRQSQSWTILRRLYDEETFATVGLRNLKELEKFLADSSELRRRFSSVLR